LHTGLFTFVLGFAQITPRATIPASLSSREALNSKECGDQVLCRTLN